MIAKGIRFSSKSDYAKGGTAESHAIVYPRSGVNEMGSHCLFKL